VSQGGTPALTSSEAKHCALVRHAVGQTRHPAQTRGRPTNTSCPKIIGEEKLVAYAQSHRFSLFVGVAPASCFGADGLSPPK